ncbi:MAG: NYN domain-containing protein, partial [Planctomycetota bacterium]
EVDFEKVKRAFGARKAFYYDCLDSQQGDDEEDHAFKSRVKSQQDYFDRIRAIPGMHVREGHLSQGKKKQQKEVDVLLSVEMLTHAFNKNITKAVLLSGDGDFKPLVDALVRIGTWVHVAYDPRIGSKDLARAADDHSRLDIVTLCSWVKTDSDARGPYHFPVHYSGFDYDDPILRNNPETR